MKYILLASASAFAFAGAAMAEVTFSGSAVLGYNDTTWVAGTEALDDWGDTLEEYEEGFYWSATLGMALTKELNNGLTAGVAVNVDIADGDFGSDLEAEDYVFWLESENAGLYFGDTDTAAGKHWSGVPGMENDGFTTAGGDYTVASGIPAGDDPTDPIYTDPLDPGYIGPYSYTPGAFNSDDNIGAAVLRGDISYGGIEASVSYLIPSSALDSDGLQSNVAGELEQLSIGVSGSVSNFNFALAYQDGMAAGSFEDSISAGDFSTDKIYGVSVGTTFGGADVMLAYARNDTVGEDSIGISGSYPIGPVTVGAYYVAQDNGDGNTWGVTADYASGPIGVSVYYEDYDLADADWGIDASYGVGNGLTVYAGVAGAGDAPYVGGEFDMGNGATIGLSYADDNATHDQEDAIGARSYQEGTTAWVSFTF